MAVTVMFHGCHTLLETLSGTSLIVRDAAGIALCHSLCSAPRHTRHDDARRRNLQPFRDALDGLDEALAGRISHPASSFLRDPVILRFTFAFEAAISTLRRYLGEMAALGDANRMSPRRCLREAADLGLIAECSDWMLHADNRNRTVHAYSEPMADAIAANAVARNRVANAVYRYGPTWRPGQSAASCIMRRTILFE